MSEMGWKEWAQGREVWVYITSNIALLTHSVLLDLVSDAPLWNLRVFKEPSLENSKYFPFALATL